MGSQRVPRASTWVRQAAFQNRAKLLKGLLEATPGIEPGYTVLQTVA